MAYAYTQHSWNGSRFFGLFVALAINVLLLYGLASGLVFPTVDQPNGVIEVIVPEEPTKPLPPHESDRLAARPGHHGSAWPATRSQYSHRSIRGSRLHSRKKEWCSC